MKTRENDDKFIYLDEAAIDMFHLFWGCLASVIFVGLTVFWQRAHGLYSGNDELRTLSVLIRTDPASGGTWKTDLQLKLCLFFVKKMSSRVPGATSPDQCVLVINTGGTFGMKKKGRDKAYSPATHDELLDVLRRSETFGKSTGDRFTISDVDGEKQRDCPRTVSYKLTRLYSVEKDKKGKTYLKDKLLDSSNMTPAGWNEIANTIKLNYCKYIGFVVIHGTDTMVYSASILSFMLENLGKPVVITGAQIPIFEARSDARDNLINSVIIAGTYKIPQVLLCFGRNVLKGNRCVKYDASGFDAFISPNHPPLIELGVRRKVNPEAVEEGQQSHNSLRVCEIDTPCNVGILRLYPGITEETVKKTLDGMQGVVLQSFGAGNAPDAPWFKKELQKFIKPDRAGGFTNKPARARGFPNDEPVSAGGFMINVTQCHKGTVTSAYACGKMLKDECGVLAGGDMTEEAAFCKLCYVLAKSKKRNYSKSKIIEKLENPLRGEMAEPESDEE